MKSSYYFSNNNWVEISIPVIKYIDKLDSTSKHFINKQEVDVQHLKFNIENINKGKITHILLDWGGKGNNPEWGTEYLTFDKDNNTTLTWTNALESPDWQDPMVWDSTTNTYLKEYRLTIGFYDGSFYAINKGGTAQNPKTYYVKINNFNIGTSTIPITAKTISNHSDNLISANQISANSDSSKIIFKLTDKELSTNGYINYDFVYDRNSNYTIHLKQKENVQSTSVITMKYEMSSNITDIYNNKNDSFVKLTNEKDCNKLLVSDAIFNNVITFTAQESFKFSENISSEFKKVFKKHRGAICYPEVREERSSPISTRHTMLLKNIR